MLFLIAAPEATWPDAVALALEGAVVVLVVVTSRGRASVSRHRALAAGCATLLVVLLVALGVVPKAAVLAFAGALTLLLIVLLVRGLVQLISQRGVTGQAVAGALTIYLLFGLGFAWTIAVVARILNTPYFSEHVSATTSRIVYFSFTTLTTTGYGDLTAATSVGHAIAVLEMVLGQLYLVTVIGVLVGNFAGRRRQP